MKITACGSQNTDAMTLLADGTISLWLIIDAKLGSISLKRRQILDWNILTRQFLFLSEQTWRLSRTRLFHTQTFG